MVRKTPLPHGVCPSHFGPHPALPPLPCPQQRELPSLLRGARENRRRTTPSKPGALQSKSGEAKSKSVALRRSASQSKNGAQSIALRGPDFTLQSDALRSVRFAENGKSPVANQGLAHSSAVWRSQKKSARCEVSCPARRTGRLACLHSNRYASRRSFEIEFETGGSPVLRATCL